MKAGAVLALHHQLAALVVADDDPFTTRLEEGMRQAAELKVVAVQAFAQLAPLRRTELEHRGGLAAHAGRPPGAAGRGTVSHSPRRPASALALASSIAAFMLAAMASCSGPGLAALRGTSGTLT